MNGSAAQREDSAEPESYLAPGTESTAAIESAVALKRLAAERLAAHRRRRAEVVASEAEREARVQARMEALRRESSHGASRVRDAVAARYQQSVSYREYLAVEAGRALEQAQAEAEVAARNARAVAEAQMQLLEELEQWEEPVPSPRERAIAEQRASTRGELAHALADIALGARELISEPPSLNIMELPAVGTPGGLQVRLHEQLGSPAAAKEPYPAYDAYQAYETSLSVAYAAAGERVAPDEQEHLDDLHQIAHLNQEIEFRLAPEFQEHTLKALPIQANIIEFPRQLVAPRRARPRLAEGPLREDAPAEPQLRIFEVEAEQISVDPEAGEGSGAPEWQSLLLDAVEPEPIYLYASEVDARLRPQTAPLALRLMAVAVDGCCIGVSFAAFAAIIAEIAGTRLRELELPMLGAAAAGTLLTLAVLYQILFFTLAEATPGMRYARLGLCTFNDEYPTRSAMRKRVFAQLLAACPLGLGLVWMFLDDDRLGWHDRISRMYPRAY